MYNQRGLPAASHTSLGLDERVERVLCYVLLWVSGLFFLIFERNPAVRKHALQSVIVFGTLSVILFILSFFGGVLGSILLIGWIFSLAFGLIHAVVWIVAAVAWVFFMLAAYFSPATFVGGRGSSRY